MFHVPEKYRVVTGQGATSPAAGNNGVFYIPLKKKSALALGKIITYGQLQCVVSDGSGWLHVSVCVVSSDKKSPAGRTPTWEEMCVAKDTFWDQEDACVQFHPPKKEYVNDHKWVLHIWQRIGSFYETPPRLFV